MENENKMTEMKNANTKEYKKRLRRSAVMKALCTFLLFPLTFVSFLSGGFYAARDALLIETASVPFTPHGKSRSLRQSPGENTVAEIEPPYETDAENTETDKPENAPDQTADPYFFDRSLVPEGKYGIIPLSMYKPIDGDDMYIKNSSSLQIDYRDYLKREIDPTLKNEGDYEVLIIHTHGTEAYTPKGVFYCDAGYYPRSDDKSENVIGIGDVFERIFIEAGIKTLHCEVPIDKSSYSKSYENAAKIIKEFIRDYPTIRYIFDVHRDSVALSSGEKVKAVTAVNGRIAAQVMFVIGTDKLVRANSNWGDNFALAIRLQLALNEKYAEFVRPINLKQGAYNQFYTPFSILIEVGCDGNTFEEAEYSAGLTAHEIVHILKGE